LAEFLIKLGDQPRGLKALGFGKGDLDDLVEGTIPQARVLMLAPSLEMSNLEVEREQLRNLFEEAMEY
jgi:hydroxyacid-oxoacid transhydrogenase